ncbi:PAK4-inhibitor INKA2 [Osmerus eperlanus]|uniref:PAK4-inhibitor INKA2 n=1 Tax=Osmerus eperlanus TaxID=29151 RepID=UPI002E13EA5F
MERPHLSKSERKNMDTCLRRLKQELLSMKEAGDGLHAQMNSMMGALQELKLLQVQTALEQLDVSGRPVPAAPAPPAPQPPPPAAAPISGLLPSLQTPSPRPPLVRTTSRESQSQSQWQSWADQHRSSLDTSPSSSSLESETLSLPNPNLHLDLHPQPRPLPRRVSGYTAPQVDFCGPRLSPPPPAPAQAPPQPLDLPGILYSLSREGPSLDNDFSQDSMDDSSDWTSSLMSRCRNRQPLVLGDNVFADLVGNWLDLPELEREGRGEGGEAGGRGSDRPDSPAHPLRLSRSQEICRKFSLTTNIFKKFLRGVRPDRDKLLKERPGWAAAPETGPEGGLSKRPRKAPASKARGSFYLPFWAAGAPQGKGRPGMPALAEPGNPRPLFSGILLDRRLTEGRVERTQPLFDYNTAVWV